MLLFQQVKFSFSFVLGEAHNINILLQKMFISRLKVISTILMFQEEKELSRIYMFQINHFVTCELAIHHFWVAPKQCGLITTTFYLLNTTSQPRVQGLEKWKTGMMYTLLLSYKPFTAVHTSYNNLIPVKLILLLCPDVVFPKQQVKFHQHECRFLISFR